MTMSEYIPQVCGFLLLALPPTYFLSLPFLDYEYSFRKRILYSIIYCADVICALMIPLMMNNHAITWILRLLITADSIFSLFVYFRLLKAPIFKKILGAAPSILYVYMIFIMRSIITKGNAPIVSNGYQWIDVMFLSGMALIFIPLGTYFLKKRVQPDLSIMNVELLKNECIYFTVCFCGYSFTLVAYIFMGRKTAGSWMYMSPIFLVIMCMILFLYYLVLKESRSKNEEAYQKKVKDTRILQYRKLELEIDKARRQQHDETHYLTNLYILIEKGDLKAAKEYMEHITGKHTLLIKEDFCENHIINNLLQYYIGWAKTIHVDYDIHIHVPEFIMDEDDLCVLFGNLLENAIFCNEEIPEENRFLRINAEVKEDILLISLENACDYVYHSDQYKKENRYQSADSFNNIMRKDADGLQIIEQIAKKYNGSADFCFDKKKHEFISRVLLKFDETEQGISN